MESKDRTMILEGFKKIFGLISTITDTLEGIRKANDKQDDINIFLVKRIERLEKREKINSN